MIKMNEETKAVYKKYGVSPSGSCLQLVIQLPILWALYRVIYNFPAYVPNVKAVFSTLVDKLVTADGASAFYRLSKMQVSMQSSFQAVPSLREAII